MKREELDFLEDEMKDKVMALYGKAINKVKTELDDTKTKLNESEEKVKTYETKINEFNEKSKGDADWKAKYDELNKTIQDNEAKNQLAEQEKILNNNILEVFGDKKFTSEYAKNGLMNDIKTELSKVENKGKGIKDIFEGLTKDSTGIFASTNELADIPSAGEVTDEVAKNVGEIKLNPMFKSYN